MVTSTLNPALLGCLAPAKLNLFLHVIGRRPDGYHLLQTAFRLIDCGDRLDFHVRTDGSIHRTTALAGVPEEQDLVVRAARRLQQYTGCSLGAFHAANLALKFPETFDYALCLSGRYDIEAICGRSDFIEVYYNNPVAYASLLHGEPLERIRRNTFLTLVCGQGAWEDTCLNETHRLADILVGKGIGHERDIWGHDVEHHWFWWRKQIAYHFGKRLG